MLCLKHIADESKITADIGKCEVHSFLTVSACGEVSQDLTVRSIMQASVKTKQEIYENSMLEDDPNENTVRQRADEPRWGPKHKGAQTLAKYYSKGKSHRATCEKANETENGIN